MWKFFDCYQRGLYQQVYDELLSMGEQVYDPSLYEDALAVMREIMRRIRVNIEVLIPRLQSMGYQFEEGGSWTPPSEKSDGETKSEGIPLQLPTWKTREHLLALETMTGPLPLSLSCWFEEVGHVNFIGTFPSHDRAYGSILDPLYIESVETLREITMQLSALGGWEEEPELLLAPDCYHKYGYSGGGAYTMHVPQRSIDGLFLNEPHNETFVNYLRLCLQWGGFPGLGKDNRLKPEVIQFLTQDLLPF